MKNQIILIVLILLPLISFSQHGGNFSLTIIFDGIDTGKVDLLKAQAIGRLNFLSGTIKDGRTIITGKLKHPTKVSLSIKTDEKYRTKDFIIEPGRIFVNVDTNITKAFWWNYIGIKVKGSPSNDIYQREFSIPFEALNNKIKIIESRYEPGNKYPFDSIAMWTKEIMQLRKSKVELIKDFVSNNNNNPSVVYVSGYGNYDYTYNDFTFLGENLKDLLDLSEDFSFKKSVFETRQRNFINDACPKFSLIDTASNVISLTDLKGKYVFIDFWASWCKPCIADQPNLLALYNLHKTDEVLFVGVSIDDNNELWENALNKHPLPWGQYIDSVGGWKGQVASALNINGVPLYIILNPKGVIIYRGRQEASTKIFLEYIMRKDEEN